MTPRLHLTGDGTGPSTRRIERWIAARVPSGHRHAFVKLHALVATSAQFPHFCAAHVTDANTNDTTELPRLLEQIRSDRPLGNVALDKGYFSKRNAQAIADRGGRPVITLRKNIPSPRLRRAPRRGRRWSATSSFTVGSSDAATDEGR